MKKKSDKKQKTKWKTKEGRIKIVYETDRKRISGNKKNKIKKLGKTEAKF